MTHKRRVSSDRVKTTVLLPKSLRARLAADCITAGEGLSERVERLVRLGLRWETAGRAALVAPTHWQARVEAASAAMEKDDG